MTTPPSEPECFALLSDRQRLHFLRVLKDNRSRPLTLREAAERVAERAYEHPSSDDVRRLRLALYHNHIPRLEEADVVAYDPDDDTVEVRPNFETLATFMTKMSGEETPRAAKGVRPYAVPADDAD